MKKVILCCVMIFCIFNAKSQNLVPNGDFEQWYSCPYTASQISQAKFWINPSGGSSDYFNLCGTGFANIPYAASVMNFQQTNSGAGYAGMYLFYEGVGTYREYVEITLDSALIAGRCYNFEMYFNLSNNSKYTVSTVGVYFSDTLIYLSSNANFPFIPQITNTSGNFPDSLNWSLVSSNYTAVGGERYLTIGNFNVDVYTDSTIVSPFAASISYIYIDDVSLTSCLSGGVFDSNNSHLVSVYPNPSSGQFNFSGLEKESKIEVFDITGRIIYQSIANSDFETINISDKAQGIYFYRITKEMKLVQSGKICLE